MKNVNRSTPAPSIDQIIRVVVKNGLFPVRMTIRVDPPNLRPAFRDFFNVSKEHVFLVQRHCFKPWVKIFTFAYGQRQGRGG